jgi:flavin-dependent dehydrogenase
VTGVDLVQSQAGILDVIVIGGGPAGSTAGNLLAQAGHRVLVLDKEDFPRFHIGESLLPCDLPIFERLGMDMLGGAYLHKQGAEFFDESTGDFAFYDFADALPSSSTHAYQVERAAFDHALLSLAERAGARVQLRTKVREVSFDDREAIVSMEHGELRARFVVDATGQDAFLGRRGRSLEPLRGLGRGAVFCHFDGVAEATWQQLALQGNIKVLVRKDGWAWMIPLIGRRVSVGFVSHVRALDESTLDEVLSESPILQRITVGAQRTQTRFARNFSYRNRTPSGSRFACIGDAACFLDPVFSSGVSLAMLGGERLAEVLSPALREGREGEPAVLAGLADHMQGAYRSVGALVYSFYNTSLVHSIFFARDPDRDLRSGLISILAGDVWRTDNRFQSMLLRSRRRQLPGASPLSPPTPG